MAAGGIHEEWKILGYYFCETHFGLGKTNLRFSQYFQGGEMEMSKWVGVSVKSNGKIQICGIVEGWCCMKDNMLTSQQCVRCSGEHRALKCQGPAG